jgi:hypothetical protein
MTTSDKNPRQPTSKAELFKKFQRALESEEAEIVVDDEEENNSGLSDQLEEEDEDRI